MVRSLAALAHRHGWSNIKMPKDTKKPLGRVLCVTSNLPRWAGDSTTPFVLNLAEDLQGLGWEIDLLAPHAPGAALREQLSGVRVERFRYFWPDQQQTVCYQGGALINLRKNRLNYLKLPALVGAEFVAVVRRLIGQRYDIVHSHWILPQGFVGMLATGLRAVPHVVTVHGGDVFGLRGRAMNWAKAVTLRNADAVTVNSRFTAEAVSGLAPDLGNMHRIPMGVSTLELEDESVARARQVRARYRTGEGPLVVFVGRIIDEKGVADLLDAVALAREEFPDMRILIVGEGQDRPSMEERTRSLGIADRVVFSGWVDPAEVRAYFSAADIFVAPSRRAVDGWIEAQGLTVLEAMVARVPVVTTRLGGVTDSVVHEETGLLIDERSPSQLADAIRRLVADRDLAQAIVERAYARASENFSRMKSASEFSKLFFHLMSERRGASRAVKQ